MHHIVAFSESQDPAGAYVNVAAVVDQTVKTNGDDLTVPPVNTILGAAALAGTNAAHARLQSPSLRQVNPYYISNPIEALVPQNPSPSWLRPGSGAVLTVNESLNAQLDSTPGGAEQSSVIVALSDQVPTPVTGDIRTINASITLALVAGAWAFSEITLADDLPTGTYSVVGGRAVVAAGVAFRFVPVGSAYRPGGLCVIDDDNIEDPQQRYGMLGTWFDFHTTQLPGVEIMSSAAAGSATYQIYLDILVA